MAKARKLKVFRTPIGFHDAYVAATSRQAALAAWGADGNLFAQGMAEEVTDPKLMKMALESPGEVIRKARGTAGEHLTAVDAPKPRKAGGSGTRSKTTKARGKKPDRAELDAAEDALATLDRSHRTELRAIDQAQVELDRRRRQAQRAHVADRADVAARRERARRAYDRGMKAWRG